MDVCSVTFDHLMKRIVQQMHRYFLNDPKNPVSITTENVIIANTKRNPMEVMVENVSFTTAAWDNSKYLLNENAKMKI